MRKFLFALALLFAQFAHSEQWPSEYVNSIPAPYYSGVSNSFPVCPTDPTGRLCDLGKQVSDIIAKYDGSIWGTYARFLYQESTGVTPVTAVEQPAGLDIDYRQLGALGPELSSLVGGVYTATTPFGSALTGTAIGKAYVVTATVEKTSGTSISVGLVNSGFTWQGGSPVTVTANGVTQVRFICTLTDVIARPYGLFSSAVGTISNLSVKELYGYHGTQSSAPARPTWSKRVNLLTYSEDFTNAAWTKVAAGTGSVPVVTNNYATAPDGTLTAGRFQLALNGGTTSSDQSAVNVGASAVSGVSANVWLKTNDGTTKTVTFSLGSVQTVTVTGEWQQFNQPTFAIAELRINLRGTFTSDSVDLLIWHPQVNYGTTARRYQRIAAATDYDTAGFPAYKAMKGTDDHYLHAIGGGGNAKFFYATVQRPTGGAGTTRILFDDRVLNGLGGYAVYYDTANKLNLRAGDGVTTVTKASTQTVSVGDAHTLTTKDDGANLSVKIDGLAEESVARPVVVAGTTGFTRGKSNGYATNYLIADVYIEIYIRNGCPTPAEIDKINQFLEAIRATI